MKYIIILLFFLKCQISISQETNLNESIKDSLSDYGYGLVKKDIFNDSIFDYTKINNFEKTISKRLKNADLLQVKFKKRKGVFNKIVFNKKKITFENNYELDTIINSYLIEINNKKYYLIFLENSKIADLRRQLQGFLISLLDNNIYILPELQSSDSPLCIMDLDNDGEIEYLSYNPSYKATIDIYILKKNQFIKDKTYKLKAFDGYVWTINWDIPR